MTALPNPLAEAIESIAAQVNPADIAGAVEQLTAVYNAGGPVATLADETARIAYLITRMPATFAAVRAALLAAPASEPATMLDLGAGPGTAGWAALDVYQSIQGIVCYERDRDFIRMGERLGLPKAKWFANNATSLSEFPEADLVTASYMLGELDPNSLERIVPLMWKATRQKLVLVEPGTTAGYRTILRAREILIENGATIAAPCPHHEPCPMKAPSWCHFSAHVFRTRRHRLAKGGTLGHEDEKFSYLVATRLPIERPAGRVVTEPRTSKVSVRFDLCTNAGTIDATEIFRRDKDIYKRARKLRWGDVWEG